MLQGIQPAQFENVINLLANELASISDPFVLVLDDFHVIHSEAVLKILSFLLEHLPPQMHLVILTRTDPLCRFPACGSATSSWISGQTSCALHRMRSPLF